MRFPSEIRCMIRGAPCGGSRTTISNEPFAILLIEASGNIGALACTFPNPAALAFRRQSCLHEENLHRNNVRELACQRQRKRPTPAKDPAPCQPRWPCQMLNEGDKFETRGRWPEEHGSGNGIREFSCHFSQNDIFSSCPQQGGNALSALNHRYVQSPRVFLFRTGDTHFI
jgi:hypothetical protein